MPIIPIMFNVACKALLSCSDSIANIFRLINCSNTEMVKDETPNNKNDAIKKTLKYNIDRLVRMKSNKLPKMNAMVMLIIPRMPKVA